jgi:hypothetical protein
MMFVLCAPLITLGGLLVLFSVDADAGASQDALGRLPILKQ